MSPSESHVQLNFSAHAHGEHALNKLIIVFEVNKLAIPEAIIGFLSYVITVNE